MDAFRVMLTIAFPGAGCGGDWCSSSMRELGHHGGEITADGEMDDGMTCTGSGEGENAPGRGGWSEAVVTGYVARAHARRLLGHQWANTWVRTYNGDRCSFSMRGLGHHGEITTDGKMDDRMTCTGNGGGKNGPGQGGWPGAVVTGCVARMHAWRLLGHLRW